MSKRLQRNKTILMVCDMQDHFAQQTFRCEQVTNVAIAIIQSAKIFNIPILATEHRKKVSSQTIPVIKQALHPIKFPIIVKQKFSMIVSQIKQYLKSEPLRNQIILIGMEAHICILQTFLDLKQLNYEVWVPVDAITSLSQFERKIGIKRLQEQGAKLTSFETMAFEILKYSYDEKFTDICEVISQCDKKKKIKDL